MKILLLCFLAVQVKAVFCTHRRHGQSRNSASFLLRKVCVEVTGLKEEVSGLKEENLVLKKKVAELEENIAGSKQAGKPI